MTLDGLRAGAEAKGYKLVKGGSLVGAMVMGTKTKMQMGGSVVNPIQPVYHPAQADQQRQRNVLETGQSKPKKDPNTMCTAPPTIGISKGGKLKDVPEGNIGKGLANVPTAVQNQIVF